MTENKCKFCCHSLIQFQSFMCCRNSGLRVSLSPGFLHYYSTNQADKGYINHYSINKENLLHYNNRIYCFQPDSLQSISKSSVTTQKIYKQRELLPQMLSLILSFNSPFFHEKVWLRNHAICIVRCREGKQLFHLGEVDSTGHNRKQGQMGFLFQFLNVLLL